MIFRVIRVMLQIQTRRASLLRPLRSKAPIKTLVVLGSGGHTTEMLQLLSHLDPLLYTPLIYIVADTDDTSERRFQALGGRQPDLVLTIPRSREVGQSYVSSVGSTLYSLVVAFWLVLQVRPNLLLCNGPGTCLPVAVSTWIYRILGVCEGNLVFVESFCRVERYVQGESQNNYLYDMERHVRQLLGSHWPILTLLVVSHWLVNSCIRWRTYS